ncbi:hypothetical protein JT359_03110 [Candidatus Poribacteria bacterium]|nr:hypothetical protein [Candidatus Poribacteria bacterium]
MKNVVRLIIILVACTVVFGGVVLWKQYNTEHSVTKVTPQINDRTEEVDGKTKAPKMVQLSDQDNASQKSDVKNSPLAEQAADRSDNSEASKPTTPEKVKGQMATTQAAEKAMRDEARKQRLAALEEEKVKMEKLVDSALSRYDKWESILFPILDSKGEEKLSKSKRKAILNQMVPSLVEQLNTLSADEQRELISKVAQEDTDSNGEPATDTLLQILQTHGFEKKF